jgi:intergrase/recombinase
VDEEGFEPSTSAMPTLRNLRAFQVIEPILGDFKRFMSVDMRLRPTTIQCTVQIIRRFLESSGYIVSYRAISGYLKGYLGKAPKTYNAQVTALRRFIKEFLGHSELISSFKMAPVDMPSENCDLTKAEVCKGFNVQYDMRSKAIYLFAATTGLRKSEILDLTKDKVNQNLRSIVPQHFTRVKRSGITFYNTETEIWLTQYLTSRSDSDQRLFPISDRQWRMIWKRASEAASVKITAQKLRAWFSTELGELGVPDRYVDVFQGRAPRSVIAKHYTGKGLERLRRIYDKASLKVLG